MAMIHVNRGTTSLGVFSEQEVREGLSASRFTPSDIGWREGMTAWQPLSQFPRVRSGRCAYRPASASRRNSDQCPINDSVCGKNGAPCDLVVSARDHGFTLLRLYCCCAGRYLWPFRNFQNSQGTQFGRYRSRDRRSCYWLCCDCGVGDMAFPLWCRFPSGASRRYVQAVTMLCVLCAKDFYALATSQQLLSLGKTRI